LVDGGVLDNHLRSCEFEIVTAMASLGDNSASMADPQQISIEPGPSNPLGTALQQGAT
jgi:hypothetical protein